MGRTQIAEIAQLKILVGKYPGHASSNWPNRCRRRVTVRLGKRCKGGQTRCLSLGRSPSGWVRVGDDVSGIPLWQWNGEPVYAATRDTDQLRFLGAALARFDEMSAEEFHAFMSSATVPGSRAGRP
jgi:hypothetical protein